MGPRLHCRPHRGSVPATRPVSPPPRQRTADAAALSPELAQAVVDAGAIPLLVLCIQEPEISLKRISASALSDICKHSPEVRCGRHLPPSHTHTHTHTLLVLPTAGAGCGGRRRRGVPGPAHRPPGLAPQAPGVLLPRSDRQAQRGPGGGGGGGRDLPQDRHLPQGHGRVCAQERGHLHPRGRQANARGTHTPHVYTHAHTHTCVCVPPLVLVHLRANDPLHCSIL